ncbi:MAG: hypothetical protein ABII09_07765 [Planctomycetota bacterium]
MTQKNMRQTFRANYLQPAFLICVGVLALSASAMSATVKLAGIYMKKEPLSLKTPLSRLDSSGLMPYKAVAKQEIKNPDVLETLGTEDYIQWTLEDTSVPADSKTRFCTLFITYYGQPDQVPHVPEECYIGGGLRQVSSEAVTLTIKPGEQGAVSERPVSAHFLVFAVTKPDIWGSEITFPIFYTFSVNGEYAGGRAETRLIMNKNLFGKFSYFSKVEWKFYNNSFERVVYPDKQEALAASENLLSAILPVLEKEHWPSGLW